MRLRAPNIEESFLDFPPFLETKSGKRENILVVTISKIRKFKRGQEIRNALAFLHSCKYWGKNQENRKCQKKAPLRQENNEI